MDRDACLKKAADCREKAKSDPAHADYWADEAIICLQRAIETGGDRPITYELRGERKVPKPDE